MQRWSALLLAVAVASAALVAQWWRTRAPAPATATGPARPPATPVTAVLERARAAALQDDWNEVLALSQQAGEAGGAAARLQAEVARERAAQPGSTWQGSGVALGLGADDAVLVAVLGDAPPPAGARKVLRLIDVGAGLERKRLVFERPVVSASLGRAESGSTAAALLVRLEGGALVVIDLTTFERLSWFELPPAALAAAAPGRGKLLIGDRGLLVADLRGGPRERLCDEGADPFIAVEASATMGLGLRQSGRLETWHLERHNLVSVAEGLRAPADLPARVFVSDDGALVSLHEGVRRVVGKPAARPAVLAGAQGRWAATAPALGEAGPLEVWDLAQGRRSLVLPVPQGGVLGLAFTESARTLAVLGPQGVQTWKLPLPPDALRLLRSVPQRVVVFAPSGLLASADESAFVLASVEGASGFTRRGSLKLAAPPPGASPGVAFSAQGLHVAVAGADGVQVAALGPSASLSFSARVPVTGGVALSTDGEQLFVAGPAALVALAVRTEKELWTLPTVCTAVAFSANPARGSLVCAEASGLLQWLEPGSGALRGSVQSPPGLRALAVSSTTFAVAVASAAGATLKRGDQHEGRLLPGTGPAAQVAFSPRGGLLATASRSGEVLLWSVRRHDPELLARLPGCGGEPTSLSFSPLGVALAAACGGSPYLVPIPEWLEE